MTALKNLTALAAAVLVAGLIGTAAEAAPTVACATLSPDATNKLLGNAGCQAYGETRDPNPANFDGLFALDGWEELVEIDARDVNGTSGKDGFTFTSVNGNLGGTWAISGFANYTLAIILKDGNQAPAPTLLYLIDSASGTWTTPWVNRRGNANPSLSNVQLWGVANVSKVPLPAAGLLMFAGLGGLGLASRRKARA
jgi:hypothetical protein